MCGFLVNKHKFKHFCARPDFAFEASACFYWRLSGDVIDYKIYNIFISTHQPRSVERASKPIAHVPCF
jgi:hypothetical protein